MRDFYLNILGLKSGATSDEIKKAYRKKAFEYHPDKNLTPNAKKKFSLINEAYDGLNSLEDLSTRDSDYKEHSVELNKKQHRNLTKVELDKRLKYAQLQKSRKIDKEKNILTISLLELENSLVLKLSNWMATFSLFFALILFADLYLLQPNIELGIVTNFEYDYNGQKIHIKMNNNKKTIIVATSINDARFQVIRDKYLIELYKTPILKEIAYVRKFSHRKIEPMVNYSSYYSIFGIIFSLFSLPITNFIFKGANSFYIIFVHLNIGFPLIGLLIVLSY